jgi:hypothetical protein
VLRHEKNTRKKGCGEFVDFNDFYLGVLKEGGED